MIDFLLKSGKSFTDVLPALTLPGVGPTDAAPWLRIGLHVQSFAGDYSESFINPPIPEPETYAMLLAGLGLVGFMTCSVQVISDTSIGFFAAISFS